MSPKNEYITTFYKCSDTGERHHLLLQKIANLRKLDSRLADIHEEHCFYVASSSPLEPEERRQILWLIEPTPDDYVTISDSESTLRSARRESDKSCVIEVGPRLNYCSPFSTNAVSILKSSCKSTSVYRLERSTIYQLFFHNSIDEADPGFRLITDALHDPMVEMIYKEPIKSFDPNSPRAKIANGEPELQPSAEVDIIGRGDEALREVSKKLSLFFDDWDVDYYVNLFTHTIKRNPTIVECFDLAQSNSEHSRHWFFKGILDIEGRDPSDESLIDMVASTQNSSNQNNVIKFEDNSSAIEGFGDIRLLRPKDPSCCSEMEVPANQQRHIIFTAETHNFPTGVAPFPGAATGTGGRIRDVQATGRGAHVIAGTAGYSFGNLLFDDYELDWENPHELYPNNLARPSKIAVEASNGASDYGNKFGEPIIAGFARSFGMRLSSSKSGRSERWEYLKPIMFTGGIGSIDADGVAKAKPEKGMKVAKVGGPVYRIGIGGGAASSASTADKDNNSQADFNAVQRGDPEMEQKLNRVIRACIENRAESFGPGGFNPILSIHDQGAGGNGNVLKEIVEPLGATIDANDFTLGDHTVNILELWAAEYQESDAVLLPNSDKCQAFLERVSRREKCKVDVVGRVQDDGKITLVNFADHDKAVEKENPIDLKLEHVIGSMPRKTFKMTDYANIEFLSPAKLIEMDEDEIIMARQYDLLSQQIYRLTGGTQIMKTFEQLLKKVLKLPSVASKRYLTTKVDRCVTGLIAGQQCLGPLHTPIGDYALVALSHFEHVGAVTSIGEQPIKGLVSAKSNATMSVAEALTNMVFCVITSLKDVKCSANWMWAAKLPGEGARLRDTCSAMCKLMSELGIAVDGGKDSLSMSACVDPRRARKFIQAPEDELEEDDSAEIVKSPGTLVISAYAPVPDIRCKVTPILSCKPKQSHLVYVNLAHPSSVDFSTGNKFRLGGSALLQTLGQVGDEAPCIEYPELLRDGFKIIQDLIREGVCTAGHDVSDGGLIVCALEMAIASNCGLQINIKAEKAFRGLSRANSDERIIGPFFAEECGVIIEVDASTQQKLDSILDRFEECSIQAQRIGFGSYEDPHVSIKFEHQLLLDYKNNEPLRCHWEATSKRLDTCQANSKCVMEEYDQMSSRPLRPQWKLTFEANSTNIVVDFDEHYLKPQPKVAVIREEGINGDREMIASLALAGFQVFDVTVTDLADKSKPCNLSAFSGIVFPGGFSYADVFGSGRGFAASLFFNKNIQQQLVDFRRRPETFSLGVCNGCQLMALLGFLDDLPDPRSNEMILQPKTTVRLEHNDSGRFECRFSYVRIDAKTNSIMLKDMQDSSFGVWVAHGEGKFKIEQSVEQDTETRVALRYVDDVNEPTMKYPMNPNGSDLAAAGLCSRDGRHLAMMPHPERCTQMWQWPYIVPEWIQSSNPVTISPWMKMFVNAYDFCKKSL